MVDRMFWISPVGARFRPRQDVPPSWATADDCQQDSTAEDPREPPVLRDDRPAAIGW